MVTLRVSEEDPFRPLRLSSLFHFHHHLSARFSPFNVRRDTKMRVKTLEIRWHDSKPINACDFQPVPHKKARPATDRDFASQSYRLATAGDDNNVRVRFASYSLDLRELMRFGLGRCGWCIQTSSRRAWLPRQSRLARQRRRPIPHASNTWRR